MLHFRKNNNDKKNVGIGKVKSISMLIFYRKKKEADVKIPRKRRQQFQLSGRKKPSFFPSHLGACWGCVLKMMEISSGLTWISRGTIDLPSLPPSSIVLGTLRSSPNLPERSLRRGSCAESSEDSVFLDDCFVVESGVLFSD